MLELPMHFLELAKSKLRTCIPLGGRIADMGAKTYIGTKVIHAVPMSRSDYIHLRGWNLPKDENGSAEGYLVQYADQDNSNVSGFTGYVSWSPKDVFEAAYQQIPKKEY